MAEQAVDAFVAMRAVEGEKMKADVAGRLTTIETLVAKIEENSAGRVQAYSDKLYARLQELLGGFAPVRAVQGMAEPYHYRNKAINLLSYMLISLGGIYTYVVFFIDPELGQHYAG